MCSMTNNELDPKCWRCMGRKMPHEGAQRLSLCALHLKQFTYEKMTGKHFNPLRSTPWHEHTKRS